MNYKSKHFIENIVAGIKIDRSFQRKACWSEKACRSYLFCAHLDRAPYPIVVADVLSGETYSEKEGDEVGAAKYRRLRTGKRYDYISLDGQNRVNAWIRLFNDEIHLTGTWKDADDNAVQLKASGQLFSQLPIRLQDKLNDTIVSVRIMKNCRYEDLHDIFVNINSGDALNSQEKRNAINSEISEYIRQRAENKKTAGMFSQLAGMDKTKISRSGDAEWVLKSYMIALTEEKYTINAKTMDNFYLMGKGKRSQNVPQYSIENLTRFSNILSMICDLTGSRSSSKVTSQKMYWLCLSMATYLQDHEIDILDWKSLFNILDTVDTKLSSTSRIEHGLALSKFEKRKERAYAKGKDFFENPPSPSDHYFTWQVGPTSPIFRDKRWKAVIKELKQREDYCCLVEQAKAQVA